MPLHGWMILGIGLLLAADAGDDARKEAEKLQGDWKVVSYERGGQARDKKGVGSIFTFQAKDGTILIVDPNSNRTEKATFKLDPAQKPKHMDLVIDEGKKSIPAVYELNGDELKVCFDDAEANPRPKEVASKEGTKMIVLTLKREKK